MIPNWDSVGQELEGYMLVINTSVGQARNDSSFLSLTLSNGKKTIGGKHWNWPDTQTVPQMEQIVYIRAKVDAYQGNFQLIINELRIAESHECSIEKFVNSLSPEEIQHYIGRFNALRDSLSEKYQALLSNIFNYKNIQDKYFNAPAAEGHHHSYLGGLLEHSVTVAERALLMASSSSVKINRDILVLGALLHDLGKIFSYDYHRPPIKINTNGKLVGHIFIGMNIISLVHQQENVLTNDEYLHLLHILAAHHGKLEYGAITQPVTLEAEIVHLADNMDFIDFKYAEAHEENPDTDWSNRIYVMKKELWLKPSRE